MINRNLKESLKTYRKVLTGIAFLLCGGMVIITYVWFISSGLWIKWPATTNYYDQLAKSFSQGHLYLDVQPDPALLKLTDPYDPEARNAMQGSDIAKLDSIWDMSLYEGKIYLYWGPVPALILSGIKLFYTGEIGDQQLTFVFILGLFFFQCAIIIRSWRRFFPELPLWAVLSGILLVGFINPIPWILNIPRIYEAAIAGDQFFFVGGVYFIFTALDRPVYSTWRLTLAATFWLFAIGSRATMALPITFLILMVLIKLTNWGKIINSTPNIFNQMAGFCIPIAAGTALLGWYNLARFGSIFEFGFRYAITMLNQNKFQSVLFSPIYIIPNLFLYLLNPPVINYLFPFIKPIWNGNFISNFNDFYPTIYNAERITGLIYVFPFSVFALITMVNLFKHSLIPHNQIQPVSVHALSGNNNFFQWFLTDLIGSLAFEFSTILLLFYATMRYFMDVTPTLALLSIFGFWQGYQAYNHKPGWKKVYPLIGILLIVFSIIISILLAYSSDVARIKSNNPALLIQLRLFFFHFMNFPGK